jgi:hypothetical protein
MLSERMQVQFESNAEARTLNVHIVRAFGIKAQNAGWLLPSIPIQQISGINTYVVLSLSSRITDSSKSGDNTPSSHRTRTVYQSLEPYFNERFSFHDLNPSSNERLILELWSDNTIVLLLTL